jgi:DHA1 family bicyclomycin/chloramphenicol resistance-like MFS transporter
MLTRWIPGPWSLALPMAAISFSFGISRPPSNNLVLEQVDRHAGAASSLLIFIYFMLGAFAMWLISLDWADKIFTIGVLGTVCGGIILGIWILLPQLTVGKQAKLCPDDGSRT